MADVQFTEVIAAGPGWTRVQGADGQAYTLVGDRAWRNNNPGNIEYGPFAQSQGAIGSDGRFAVFPSYSDGRAAKAALIFDSPSYANKSIAQAISRYAPPNENDTARYIREVALGAGVPSNVPMSRLNPSQRQLVLDAMERVEGNKPGRVMDAAGKPVNWGTNAVSAINAVAPNPAPAPQRNAYSSETPPGFNLDPRGTAIDILADKMRGGVRQEDLSSFASLFKQAPYPASADGAARARANALGMSEVGRGASLRDLAAFNLEGFDDFYARNGVRPNTLAQMQPAQAPVANALPAVQPSIAANALQDFRNWQQQTGISQSASQTDDILASHMASAESAREARRRGLA